MNLLDMQASLKIDLADAAWDAFELSRGVIKAVNDLSRFLPDEKTYETTFILEVTSEEWKSAAAHGTYVELANKPIKWQSETVKSDDGATTYTRDTHYYMDYANGQITTIDVTGGMSVATDYKITYTKSRLGLDISSMDANLVRVRRIEYPVGDVPQTFLPFSIWEDILFINLEGERVSEKKHLVIYYEAECTAPTVTANGSFSRYLDEVIIKGAAGYALMSRGLKAEHDAKIALSAGNSIIGTIVNSLAEAALGNIGGMASAIAVALAKITTEATAINSVLSTISGYVASADAALDKIVTHVGDADSALDSVAGEISSAGQALAKITTHSGEAIDALAKVTTEVAKAGSDAGQDMENINTELGSANTALGKVAGKITDMETALGELAAMWTDEESYRTKANAYLESGDDYINKVNIGDRVADVYGTYAQVMAALARLSESRRTGKLAEASTHLSSASGHINEANTRANLVSGYVNEARERVNQAQAYISEAAGRIAVSRSYVDESTGRLGAADRHIGEANTRLGLADRYLGEANGWVALADRAIAHANTKLGLISSYISEANTNVALANVYIAEAAGRLASQDLIARQVDDYNIIATQQMGLADKYLKEAVERRNEFWSILRDKQQMRKEFSMVSQRQPA